MNAPPMPAPPPAPAEELAFAEEDVALIEGEHGPLGLAALCRTAVHEYAQMLRREKFMELAGTVEWAGGADC